MSENKDFSQKEETVIEGGDRKMMLRPSRKDLPPIDLVIDYKDPNFLRQYVTEAYHMVPARSTKLNRQQQNQLKSAIKRARQLAILPYVDNHG
jgi:small subunit ribosomal protein S18